MAINNLHLLRKVAVVALACLAIGASAVSGDLMVTNAVGVRAGLTGIVYRPSTNSVGVAYAIVDPAGTNATTFMIQSSKDLVTWTNLTQTVTVTGSTSGEASDFAFPSPKFYRMFLFNFR
jgi:hypothetical protein